MIDTVIFDMDGLMFDTEMLAMRGWIEVGERIGIPIDRQLIIDSCGLDWRGMKAFFEAHLPPAFDYDTNRRLFEEILVEMVKRDGPPEKPGLKPLLAWLRENGFTLAVATSSRAETAELYLGLSGIREYFSKVISGEMIAQGKPAPDIYLHTLEALGATAEKSLVLEDSRNGILAAHAAGIPVIMIPDMIPPTEELLKLAAAKLPSLKQVADWIASYNQVNGDINP